MVEALIAKLLATSGITALVSSRIRPGMRAQTDAAPVIVVNTISGGRKYNMAGEANIREARVQIDCYATTWLAAKTIARAVILTLSGVGFTQGAYTFQGSFLDAERDGFEDADPKLFRTSLDFRVWSNS